MAARRPTIEIYPDLTVVSREVSRMRLRRALIIGALGLIAAIVVLNSFASVPPNHVGIVTLFGRPSLRTLDNGFHPINPFALVTKINLQLRDYTLPRIPALTGDGRGFSVECTAWYRVDPNQAVKLFLDLGTYYEDTVVRPAIQVSVRKVIAMHKLEEFNGGDRALIEQKIHESLRGLLAEKYLILDRVFIQDSRP
jgi:regulator of protease activity HflC (stomatin/prohibitin superfamily)